MKKKEVYKLFEDLKILPKAFPKYTDPHTFTKEIDKVSILKFDEIYYSAGTGNLRK
ncbi:MAG: hypothetical protein NTZ48_07145 [Candidatus Omnitrophica bacterium]|nr:hypothetical protein [Candidatus Omnitrophota bacterium]